MRAFEAVGATRLVELKLEAKTSLLGVVDAWLREVGAGELPNGILALHTALIADLAAAGHRGE